MQHQTTKQKISLFRKPKDTAYTVSFGKVSPNKASGSKTLEQAAQRQQGAARKCNPIGMEI
jgi:hypothetical protein